MHLVLIMGIYNFHDLHSVVNKQAFQNEIILYENNYWNLLSVLMKQWEREIELWNHQKGALWFQPTMCNSILEEKGGEESFGDLNNY